jgi:fructose-1,6-bisphosphatase/inositol monophosphatase family enzyme
MMRISSLFLRTSHKRGEIRTTIILEYSHDLQVGLMSDKCPITVLGVGHGNVKIFGLTKTYRMRPDESANVVIGSRETQYLLEDEINRRLPEIIREAGKIAAAFFAGGARMEFKDDDTIVTEADAFVQEFIIQELCNIEPSRLGIIAEEGSLDLKLCINREYLFVIDPIDGTSQFANDLDNWVIAIALLRNFVPCGCWIYQPVLDKLYLAPLGDIYAYKEIRGTRTVIPKVSRTSDYHPTKKDIMYLGSRTFSKYRIRRTKARIQCLGSLTLHAIETILGHSLAAFSFDNKIWDICAVAEIAKRTDVEIKYTSGQEIDYEAIIKSRDKALEGDLIIAHKNVFPLVAATLKERSFFRKS